MAESRPPVTRPRSYTYSTNVRWTGARAGELSALGKPSLKVASPPEFKGEAGVWTPEDLFVASVNMCTLTTFVSMAERAGLRIASYASDAEGLLEIVDGSFRFTKITIRPRITVADASQVEQTKSVLMESHTKCLVSNSMRSTVVVEPTVTAA